jgi:microcompartment protein CcmL/EutN
MAEAVGFIETFGLTAAIEAADAAVKSADVRMIGYELTKGGGMVTVKIAGDVGAVRSAIDAAKTSAAKVSGVLSVNIIPRPAESTESVIRTFETIPFKRGAELVPESSIVQPITGSASKKTDINNDIGDQDVFEEQSVSLVTGGDAPSGITKKPEEDDVPNPEEHPAPNTEYGDTSGKQMVTHKIRGTNRKKHKG